MMENMYRFICINNTLLLASDIELNKWRNSFNPFWRFVFWPAVLVVFIVCFCVWSKMHLSHAVLANIPSLIHAQCTRERMIRALHARRFFIHQPSSSVNTRLDLVFITIRAAEHEIEPSIFNDSAEIKLLRNAFFAFMLFPPFAFAISVGVC